MRKPDCAGRPLAVAGGLVTVFIEPVQGALRSSRLSRRSARRPPRGETTPMLLPSRILEPLFPQLRGHRALLGLVRRRPGTREALFGCWLSLLAVYAGQLGRRTFRASRARTDVGDRTATSVDTHGTRPVGFRAQARFSAVEPVSGIATHVAAAEGATTRTGHENEGDGGLERGPAPPSRAGRCQSASSG